MKFTTEKIEEKAAGIKFSVEKKLGRTISAQVCLVLDKSGSFEDEYRTGLVQEVMQSILPFALAFDADQSLDLITFNNRAKEQKAVTLKNWENYIPNNGLDRDGDWGGTYYSPPMEMMMENYGFTSTKKSGGFMGIGATTQTVSSKDSKDGKPVICYLITDGDNSDSSETEKIIADAQKNKQNIYFMLVGLDNDGRQKFKFLHRMADEYDNCGLATISDLRNSLESGRFDELMLPDEMLNWLK